ncbi:hypothetical protein [Microcystis phage Mwe-JY13]
MSKRETIDWSLKSDEEFVKDAEMQIWLSAYANNNPRAPAHEEVDKAYDEAKRREKPWLYKRAWNQAYQSCGYELTEDDRRAAMPSAGETA